MLDPINAKLKDIFRISLSWDYLCCYLSWIQLSGVFATRFWTSTDFAPIREPVPTTPSVLQIKILFFISSILSTCFAISAAQFANFNPNEIMLACWPWVLPTAGSILVMLHWPFLLSIDAISATFGSMICNASSHLHRVASINQVVTCQSVVNPRPCVLYCTFR